MNKELDKITDELKSSIARLADGSLDVAQVETDINFVEESKRRYNDIEISESMKSVSIGSSEHRLP